MKETDYHEMLDFYACQGWITDPKEQAHLFDGLPSGIPELVEIVQGVMLHLHWAERYGLQPAEARRDEANLRFVFKQLETILQHDEAPLIEKRPLEKRILGTCRDFSTFLCAFLRYQGVPARARCGFGTYFLPGKFEDHWICEYWQVSERRWVRVDAQLDEMQREVLGIDFDPLDMPPGRFLTGGEAWQKCRAGELDPEKFGIFDMHGLWFVRGNLVRDVASLNKVELLPWDCWGLIHGEDSDLTGDDWALLDQAAEWTLPESFSFSDLRSIYEEGEGLKVPAVIKSYIGGRFEEVGLT
jgi:hypothetical protein